MRSAAALLACALLLAEGSAGATEGIVVAEEAQAARAGAAILARGGNAVDAAVATAFVLAVTHPQSGNLGGGGFAIVFRAGRAEALDFREAAPARSGPGDTLSGHRAVAVPGTVAGLAALHARHGSLPWREVVAPALALARDGFVVDENLAGELAAGGPARLLGPVPRAGDRRRNRALAATLARIADRGAAGFYRGRTAALIAAEMARGGGFVGRRDLLAYRAVWRAPLAVRYRGLTVYAPPPPSSGGVVLALTAAMLAGDDLGALAPAARAHLLAEVWRRAFAARNRFLGDPAFVAVPVERLLSPSFAAALRAGIDPARATPSAEVPALVEGAHTTHLGVVDAAGDAVALTTTLNTSFGSGVVVAGFVLNNSMDDFAHGRPNAFGLEEGPANAPAPGKRMLSSMCPTVVVDGEGRVRLVLGAQGGPRILTAVWQVLANVVDLHMDLAAAVAAPRIHHQHLPDAIFVDDGALSPDARAELVRMGHTLRPAGWFLGCAPSIARGDRGWEAAPDPRCGGLAARP